MSSLRIIGAAGLGALCVSAAAIAQDSKSQLQSSFDGVYRQAANADCALIGVDGGAIAIQDGIFHGVENDCRMENPVRVRDMDALLFDMQCSGEGSQWTERALFQHSADRSGIIMVWNGYAFIYDRCPAASAPAKD